MRRRAQRCVRTAERVNDRSSAGLPVPATASGAFVRPRHRLTPLALATAALPLLAGVAAADPPDTRGEGVHVPSLSCSGDTLHLTAVVRGVRDLGPVTVTVLGRTAAGAWSATGRSTTFPAAKPGRSTWPVDVTGLPAGTTSLRASIHAAGATVESPVLATASCAPGTEVPEVPVAPLLPLTLAVTGSAVLAVRSRRAPDPAAR